ncbi:MAG TPA: glycosyltransferase family A protein [Desulfuromonadaceae bacterium]|jgi:glycosyltransferase involved in cell wall biosynthesis
MRRSLLKKLNKMIKVRLQGDCNVPTERDDIRVSCIINFYGRLDLLSGILYSLEEQDYSRQDFEVILIEDQGGTEAGRDIADRFSSLLNIIYVPLDQKFGKMGYSRNFGLSCSRGQYVLFLDDDTVILQKDFLTKLGSLFLNQPGIDAVIPHGEASFSLVHGRYSYHEPYFMTSRCTAYRRSVLTELSGFVSDFIGQEDVEFVIRFTLAGKNSVKAPELEYYHPPLLVPNLRKPKAVGNSFYSLKSRYPFLLWFLVILNCARHAPLYCLPVRRYREMGRFGIGFILGVIASMFKKKGFHYY